MAHARTLYQEALDLLSSVAFDRLGDNCQAIVNAALGDPNVMPPAARPLLREMARSARQITDLASLQDAVSQVSNVLGNDLQNPERLVLARQALARSIAAFSQPQRLGTLLDVARASRDEFHGSASAHPALFQALEQLGQAAAATFGQVVGMATGLAEDHLASELKDAPWLRPIGTWQETTGFLDGVPATAMSRPAGIPAALDTRYLPSTTSLWSCVPPNPELDRARQHAELNLMKLRSGRNIAGMKRELEPYAAPTDVTQALPTIGVGG